MNRRSTRDPPADRSKARLANEALAACAEPALKPRAIVAGDFAGVASHTFLHLTGDCKRRDELVMEVNGWLRKGTNEQLRGPRGEQVPPLVNVPIAQEG